MPKKNRKPDRAKKMFEKTDIESVEAHVESTQSEKDQIETALSDSIPPAAVNESKSDEQPANAASVLPANDVTASDEPPKVEDEDSADSMLDDVRQSLIEDETVKDEKKSKKWWRRVAKGLQKDKKTETEVPVEAEADLTPVSVQTDLPEEKETEEYSDEIDELIDMLEAETSEETAQVSHAVVTPVEPEPEVDIEELKKQAFRPRGEGEEEQSLSEVRSVALADGEEVFVEVQATTQDPLEERLASLENLLRPYRSYLYFGFAVLGVVMAVIAGAVLLNIYRQSQPAAPVVDPNLPFPTSISLPGGLNFSLGKGALKDGQWNPRGPEWLEGTEVCRWVAIPWSRQLEAVIRTLNPNDRIELVMSNNDRLVYEVYSVQQLTNAELQDVKSDSPCLLLILAEAESETRWVLTALP